MEFATAVYQESSRLHPVVASMPRYSSEEFVYDGVRIPAGVDIHMGWFFGSRDPEVFADPHEYQLDRSNRVLVGGWELSKRASSEPVSRLEGRNVNKSELIEAIAKSADISKAAAGRALDATVTSIRASLRKGSTVTLVGFGTFYVGKRAARSGRNPRTGASIKIKSAKIPKFRAGKALKDALN